MAAAARRGPQGCELETHSLVVEGVALSGPVAGLLELSSELESIDSGLRDGGLAVERTGSAPGLTRGTIDGTMAERRFIGCTPTDVNRTGRPA